MSLSASRIVLAICAGLPGTAKADPAEQIVSEARAFCESYENGSFQAGAAITEVNLDGIGQSDRIVDESQFQCTSMKSAYCGSGGCTVHAVIGNQVWSFQAEGWKMIDWNGRPILLIARDGGWCGGAGSQVCFEAVVWSGEEMLSVMPAQN